MVSSPLVDDYVMANTSNFTVGRRGTKIDTIFMHHMAGVLTARQCGNIFAKAGRGGSAHYGIGSDGRIGCYVDEGNIAWHCGNWPWNCRSIGIELSNSSTGGDWPVSDRTLELAAQLVADIAKRNGMGRLVVGQNLKKHNDVSSTVCPGPYVTSRMQWIADRANAINYPPAPTVNWVPMDVPRIMITNAGAELINVTTKEVVKTYSEGISLECDQKTEVNGVLYLRTKYSTSKGINNGFAYSSLHEVPAPEPEPEPELPSWVDIEPTVYETIGETNLYNIVNGSIISTYRGGTEITVVQKTTWDGVEYARTEWSKEKGLNNGFRLSDLKIPSEEPDPEPEPEPEPEDPTVGILQKIIDFIKHIIDLITEKK